MTKRENSGRIGFISWIQFIGVLSVIIGHSMNSLDLPNFVSNVSYPSIKGWIYTYHMPLFFLISAFLFSYKGGFKKGYKNVFVGRFQRLLVPYFIWNIAFIIPKILMSSYISDQVELNPIYFLKIMLYPRNNILGHTWFLCGLFEMFVIAILFEKLRSKKQFWIPVFAILVLVNCFGVRERFLAVGDLMKNAIYFWAGLLLGEYGPDKVTEWLKDKYIASSIILCTLVFTAVWIFDNTMLINTMLLGFIALALFALIQVKFNIEGGIIEYISQNSFAVYILHWPVIMVARFIFYTKLHFNAYISMIIMFVSAWLVSLAIIYIAKKLQFPVAKKLCKYILGM